MDFFFTKNLYQKNKKKIVAFFFFVCFIFFWGVGGGRTRVSENPKSNCNFLYCEFTFKKKYIFMGEGARVSDFLFTKNTNLKKIFFEGWGGGARVSEFFLLKHPNRKFFLRGGGSRVEWG